MEAHQHPMSASVASHEQNLFLLFAAANGDAKKPMSAELDALGVDADNAEDSARDALTEYALAAETSTILTVTLSIGGPTQYLSAPVERRSKYGAWARTGPVTYFDSWAVPEATELNPDSPLVEFFDNEHVEMMGE
jgi:hypothetical protein